MCCTDRTQEVKAESGRRKEFAWHCSMAFPSPKPPSSHIVVTAPAACDQRALEAAAATATVTRQLQPCQLMPSPHWEKRRGASGAGREAPCQMTCSRGPKEPPQWALGSSDVWIPRGVWRLKGKRRSLQSASKHKGCCQRNGEVLGEESIRHRNAFWRKGHYFPPLFAQMKGASKDSPEVFLRDLSVVVGFPPCALGYLLTSAKESQSSWEDSTSGWW